MTINIPAMKIKYALKLYIQSELKEHLPDGHYVEVESLTIDTDNMNGNFSFRYYAYPQD